jgi:16S rRNA (cytidine1402-2'-O)-methyltransferase
MNKTSATINTPSQGKLYIVATPIGHLDDISHRAVQTLKSVDAILAEDTRHSGVLLKALGIQKPLFSLHAHNEHEKTGQIITAIQQGQSYALISDAGTPLIRDPGFTLVREARKQNIVVVPIPGACALITALCASGIPCDTFTFAGFLPTKQQARIEQLKSLRAQGHTVAFYESTHRIIACLDDIALAYHHDYEFMLAKELTKIHEAFIQGNALEIKQWLNMEPNRIKGEFVVILPALGDENTLDQDQQLLTLLLQELSLKQAVKIATKLSKTNKNTLYTKAVLLLGGNDE